MASTPLRRAAPVEGEPRQVLPRARRRARSVMGARRVALWSVRWFWSQL